MESESAPTKPIINLAMPIAVVIAGALVAGAVYFSGGHTSLPLTIAAPQQPTAQVVDISKVKTDREPFVGNPNAPVTVAEWYDYQCPFCRRHTEETMPAIIKDYVNTGKVKVVFKDFQFLGPDSQRLGQFSRAVWAIAPDKFYEWHKTIYDNQGTENTGWATVDKILALSKPILGQADTDKALQLVKANGKTYQSAMDADKAEGAAFGVTGTPGFVIGKQLIEGAQPYAAIKQVIDLTLAGK